MGSRKRKGRGVLKVETQDLQVEIAALEQRAQHWIRKAQEHANEERNWKLLLAAALKRIPGGSFTVTYAELNEYVEAGLELDRVVDPKAEEILCSLVDDDDAPPEPERGDKPVLDPADLPDTSDPRDDRDQT